MYNFIEKPRGFSGNAVQMREFYSFHCFADTNRREAQYFNAVIFSAVLPIV